MPTEAELRALLQGEPEEPGGLDVARIIRRARARRRPKQLAIGIGSGLAAVALVVPVAIGLGAGPIGISAAGGSAADEGLRSQADGLFTAEDGAAPESASGAVPPAETSSVCGASPAEASPDPSGLVLTVTPVDAAADASRIVVDVTLTNTGASSVAGATTLAPALTVARDDVVLWHSGRLSTAIRPAFELAPGESIAYTATLIPARCSPGDDEATSREELPPLGPGVYELSAAIELVPDDGGPVRLVTGPASSLVLR
ncbi:hypothetical protein [Protaetiibacter larvae]|uniref:Uncharacterized protein n=1 Tax=Protaetiibacter larvae TaxID=2592654 RepID=A0A5C1YAD6_9MICO|nr:hypothetical protein [Protaetiibacter larvae]QEO10388.1 hypothetical protein FLP23_10455 [Protaetiibacter larvae]